MKKIGIYFLAFALLGIISCGRGQKKNQSTPEAETIEITAEPEADASISDAGSPVSTTQGQQVQQQQAEPELRPQETRPAAVVPVRPEAPVREPVRSDMERMKPAPDETIIARPDTAKPKPGD
jgi:hypothetical protein